jgi:hypothetical protein
MSVASSTSPRPTVAEVGSGRLDRPSATDTVVTIGFGGMAAESTDYVLRVALTSRCRWPLAPARRRRWPKSAAAAALGNRHRGDHRLWRHGRRKHRLRGGRSVDIEVSVTSSSSPPPPVAEDGSGSGSTSMDRPSATDTVVTIGFGGTAAEGTDYVAGVALTTRCRWPPAPARRRRWRKSAAAAAPAPAGSALGDRHRGDHRLWRHGRRRHRQRGGRSVDNNAASPPRKGGTKETPDAPKSGQVRQCLHQRRHQAAR